jgi:hypothetical protein
VTTAETIEFTAWPKTPRLFRDVVVTEKIDGTNAAVGILEDGSVYAQSRKRIITPDADNFGFAAWVAANAGTLVDDLGPGLHFGEWWGAGIQRGYGLTNGDKRFSLFNVARHEGADFYTPGLATVPNLGAYTLDTTQIRDLCDHLADQGSYAAPGFMRPEGVCIYHTASRQVFKVLLENDELPKGLAE